MADGKDGVLIQAVFSSWRAGISIVPTRRDKLPDTSILPVNPETGKQGWKPLQQRLATEAEMHSWFGENGHAHPFGYATIAGAISGNLEIIDFDNPDGWPADTAEQTLAAFSAKVEEKQNGLMSRLSISKTMRNGRHVRYRCQEAVSGNQPLASVPQLNEAGEFKLNEKGEITSGKLIETRGEGGYAVGPGTPGYDHLAGPEPWNLAVITAAERELLFSVARSFGRLDVELPDESEEIRKANLFGEDPSSANGPRPGDEFNNRGDWGPLLDQLGLRHKFTAKDGCKYYQRIGSKNPIGATLNFAGKDLVRIFSSNLPIPHDKSYSKFAVYTLLHHGGDFSASARALIAEGYGVGNTRTKLHTQDVIALTPDGHDERADAIFAEACEEWGNYRIIHGHSAFTLDWIHSKISRKMWSWNLSSLKPPLDNEVVQQKVDAAKSQEQKRIFEERSQNGRGLTSHGLEWHEGELWPGDWELTVILSKPPVYLLRVPAWKDMVGEEGVIELSAEVYREANAVAQAIFSATKTVIMDDRPGAWPAIWNGTQGSKKDQKPPTRGLKAKLLDKAKTEDAPSQWKRPAMVAEMLAEKLANAKEKEEPDKRGKAIRMPDGLIWLRWSKAWEEDVALRRVTAVELQQLSRSIGITTKDARRYPNNAKEQRLSYFVLTPKHVAKLNEIREYTEHAE